jgi:hypothetical protein
LPAIKGTALIDSLKAIRKRGGEKELARILAHLQGEAKEIFEKPIDAGAWYSIDAFTDFLEADVRETANGNRDVLIGRAEKVIESQLRGVYRVFVKLGSPGYVITRIALVHAKYFEGIQIIPEVDRNSRATIKYIGFQARHSILEYTIIGFYRKALQISGAKQIAVKISVPMSDDKPYSEITITWDLATNAGKA